MTSSRCLGLAVLLLGAGSGALSAQTNRWEGDIRAFEAADRTNRPPPEAALFVGSSSIRLWKTLAQDFPNHTVLNRGFGGSQLSDAVAFAGRIVIPYRPRVVVLYAGDNDLAAGKSPEQVFADFKAFEAKVRAALPEARLGFIAIKPSPSRWPLADKARTTNRLIAEHCRATPGLTFLDVFQPMLGADGRPRTELFIADQLHLNAEGYRLWRGILAPFLDRAMR